MKRIIYTTCTLVFLLVLMLQTGCKKDTCTNMQTYTYYQPVYQTAAAVRANIKSNAPRAVQNPGKIYIKGSYIFLNELNKGIHVINNANPAAPVNVAFIDLPGNVDIAVKENTLFADFYTDLVAIDIADPLNVSVIKFVNNLFPERYYYGYNTDSSKIITDWIEKTETFDIGCRGLGLFPEKGLFLTASDVGFSTSSGSASSPVGISGSLARFTLMNNHLYTVSTDSLKITDVSTARNPVRVNAIPLEWGIETIFPFKDKLFIGSRTGMFIYSVQNPINPVRLGSFNHVRTCDPVIADGNYAYVTLFSGSTCQGFTNQLDVLNISNIQSPQHVKTYPLTNPHGLSKDGDLLFICDGNDGLKIFNAADPLQITQIKRFEMQMAMDVIAYNNIAMVIAKDGLYQYDYSNRSDIKLVSKIPVQ